MNTIRARNSTIQLDSEKISILFDGATMARELTLDEIEKVYLAEESEKCLIICYTCGSIFQHFKTGYEAAEANRQICDHIVKHRFEGSK